MTRQLKITLIALPAAVALTGGALASMLMGPQGLIEAIRAITAQVATDVPPPVAAAARAPVAVPAAGLDDPEFVTLAAAGGPEPPPPQAAAAATDDAVDYSKLNHDVKEVADTLERFNQKLLRMIAQARASQKKQQETDTPVAEETIAQ